MPEISRRRFLTRTATNVAAAGCLAAAARELRAKPLGMPIGTQAYPVRTQMAKDFVGTMKVLAGIGYETVELCSPVNHFGDAGFNVLAKYKGAEIRKMLSDVGLRCESAHFYIDELKENISTGIAWAKDLGLTQMVASTLHGPTSPNRGDMKRAADSFNKMGEQVQRAGMQLGLHNEAFELSDVEGKHVYDELLRLLDPKLIKFQFQISAIRAGFDVVEYLTNYPGRYISLHLQDWSPETKTVKPIGQGSLDWKKIFTAAKTCGVKNYFVDVSPLEAIRASYPFLRDLQV